MKILTILSSLILSCSLMAEGNGKHVNQGFLKTAKEYDAKAERAAKVAALSMQEQAGRASTDKAKFLRAAHAAACRIFGTTLGPEANNAHRNHFHVDMAKRKYKKICD